MIKLQSIILPKIWGIKTKKNNLKIGEQIIAGAYPAMDVVVSTTHENLSTYYKNNPSKFGYFPSAEFPLLIKIITPGQNLSVQVHPDDSYAYVNENGSVGKSESWVILKTPLFGYVYTGINKSSKDILSTDFSKTNYKKTLTKLKVKKGDIVDVPAGKVHALTTKVSVYEIQQPSNITYRLYDYDRLENNKPRELHLEKGIECIKDFKTETITRHQSTLITTNYGLEIKRTRHSETIDFSEKHFVVVTCISKIGRINSMDFKQFETAIIFKQELDELNVSSNSEFIFAWPIPKPF